MDEPMFTQPLMYQKIRKHPSALSTYTEKLKAEGEVEQHEVEVRYVTKNGLGKNVMKKSREKRYEKGWLIYITT